MAMTVLQAQSLREQKAFKDRVRQALVTIAQNVYSEGTGVTGHAVRAARATAVINNPDGYLLAITDNVIPQLNLATVSLTSGGADCDATDTTLQNAVSGIWNGFSGV